MLNWLADKYKNNRNITGEIKIASENVYCPSCEGVIQQFYIKFPKVKLIIIDGAK
jgi:hypothetical protein